MTKTKKTGDKLLTLNKMNKALNHMLNTQLTLWNLLTLLKIDWILSIAAWTHKKAPHSSTCRPTEKIARILQIWAFQIKFKLKIGIIRA
jgi:hypothetical protein